MFTLESGGRPHQRNWRGSNKSFLPCSQGPDTVNTQRGIGGRREAGSQRVEQKGSIRSATAVKTTTYGVTY